MAVNYLPPGLVYLSRAILPFAIPCAAFWLIQNAFGLSIPLWYCLIVPLFLYLLFGLSRSWFKSLTLRRDAAAQGALIAPSVQGNSISILRRIMHSVKDGYPDEAFHEWSEKYGSTFSFTVFSDTRDVVARFTLDSATDYLFGTDVNSISAGLPYPAGSGNGCFVDHPSNAFVKAFAKAQQQIVVRFHRGSFWPLCEFWADEVKPLRQVVDDFIQPTLAEALDRKARGVKLGKDFKSMSLLDCLAESTDDTKLIRDELVNILAAGRDSIASLLSFAMYMMCEHTVLAARLRSEILEKIGTQRPSCEDIRGMQYLRAFLDETLRLYPPIPVNARSSKVATNLPNKGRAPYYVPKDTGVINSVFLMHRRTDLWGPDALEFDPDRFLDSRLHKYLTPNPHIFVPFGAGQRICLGQQFAYNEASYYLIRLLQTFSSFSLALDAQPAEGIPPKTWTRAPGTTKGRDKIMLGTHVLLYAKGGLWVRMEEAKDQMTL
ncbi:cytochrome P450 [Desarmillaria ectypa]|nr:cytochrome P450 [Desarmillaria ectypa]